MIRILYSVLFTLCLPLIFVRLFYKGKKNKGYRQHWAERLGNLPFQSKSAIWLHGVSLGEMVAAAPLIEHLLHAYPNSPLVLTMTTPTGRAEAEKWQQKFPERIFISYLAYDAPCAIKKAIRHINPKFLIVMETELWPNLFHYLKVPIFIANARISDRALPKYLKVRKLLRPFMEKIHTVAAQSDLDQERFIMLGTKNVMVAGNIKYDIAAPAEAIKAAAKLKQAWSKRLILTAGSTHEGEEHLLIQAYKQLKTKLPNLLLIIVPRHPERFDRIESLCHTKKLTLVRSSTQLSIQTEDVLLVDQMGVLKTYYALSDLVFVGGSLVPIGGHNILEAAILGKAIVVGPFMQNARRVIGDFLDQNAVIQLKNINELTEMLAMLLTDAAARKVLGQNALTLLRQNQGVVSTLSKILKNI